LMAEGCFLLALPLLGEVTIAAAKRSTSKLFEDAVLLLLSAEELLSDGDADGSTAAESAVGLSWFMSLMIDGSF